MTTIRRGKSSRVGEVVLPPLTEHQEQTIFFTNACFNYRNDPTFVRILFFAVPNGAALAGKNKGVRARVGSKLKDEGLTSGVADVHYLQPRGGHPYLVIEMKRSTERNHKDGGLRQDQIEYLDEAKRVGAMTAVCYCADEALQAFDLYMSLGIVEGESPKNE